MELRLQLSEGIIRAMPHDMGGPSENGSACCTSQHSGDSTEHSSTPENMKNQPGLPPAAASPCHISASDAPAPAHNRHVGMLPAAAIR